MTQTTIDQFMSTIDFDEFKLIRNHKYGDQVAALKKNIEDALRHAESETQRGRVVFEVEPHALQYTIKVGDQSTTYPLGLFKIVGGKRAGKRYSIEVE